jgi:hypothetical protein
MRTSSLNTIGTTPEFSLPSAPKLVYMPEVPVLSICQVIEGVHQLLVLPLTSLQLILDLILLPQLRA